MAECTYPDIAPVIPPEDPTPGGECCSKEEILNTLGYEEITIRTTDIDGNEIVAHVLGWKEGESISRIDGAEDTTINQGTAFDLTEGVHAYQDATEIPFTVTPDAINTCEVGENEFTYSADGITVTRTITVEAIAAPTIDGLSDLTVEVGEEVDLLEGVTATDGNGNELIPTVKAKVIDYIEAHGEEYIDTGLKLNNNSRIVADMQYTYPASEKNGFRFTGDETTSNAMFRFGSHSNKYWFPKYGDTSKQITPPTGGALLDRVTIDMDKNVFKINGEVAHTFAQATSDWETGGNCYIFAINAATLVDLSVAKLYSYQIYNNDELVLDLVPALQGEEACMYDKISGNYYKNIGTGAFTYGTSEITE